MLQNVEDHLISLQEKRRLADNVIAMLLYAQSSRLL